MAMCATCLPRTARSIPTKTSRCTGQVDTKSGKRLSDIAKAVKDADRLILATDPDREGEAISWHVLEVLRAKKALKGKPVERVVFNAITRDAVLDAMRHPRQIDADLVDAYLARRALDYLVGFTLSPVLWRKLPGARSAGRVQSVALRLVCDRENEIETFVPQEYWSVTVTLETPDGARFVARLVGFDGDKLGRLDIPDRGDGTTRRGGAGVGDYRVAVGRGEAGPPQSAAALHHLDAAAGGLAQARLRRRPHHADRPAALRGRAASPICEPTASEWRRRRSPRRAPSSARISATATCPKGRATTRPRRRTRRKRTRRSARPTCRASPASLRRLARADQAQALRADLEAHGGQPDGSRRDRADDRRHRGAAAADRVALRATGQVVRFDGFLTLYQEGRDDDSGRRGFEAACRR